MCNTKFSLNQKVKAINGKGDAKPYIGQIGEVTQLRYIIDTNYKVTFSDGKSWCFSPEELEPIPFAIGQKVKALRGNFVPDSVLGTVGTIIHISSDMHQYLVEFDSDSDTWYFGVDEIEPVQETSRPKVGDAVIFHRQLLLDGKQYQGEIGIVEKDDESSVPFFVRITPNYAGWFKPNENSLTPKQHQVFAKLNPGMRVKSTRNGWLIVTPSCMASTETECDFVLWNDAGCCQSKESILDELKYATVVYNAPSNFHDAFIPFKHGGEIVWDVSQFVDPIEVEKQRQRDGIKKQIAELEKQLIAIK